MQHHISNEMNNVEMKMVSALSGEIGIIEGKVKMEIDKILAASKLCPLATTSSPKFVNFLFTVESPHKRRHSIHFIHELFCYPLNIHKKIRSF